MTEINRTFEFVVNGDVVDTYEVKKRIDYEMFLTFKEYCEKKGGVVREIK